MPKYIIFFGYTKESAKAMIEHPSDRAGALKVVLESFGGKLESFYWMQGVHDGFLIASLPDGVKAAAVSAAVASTGAVSHLESHEIFDGAAQAEIVKAAKGALAAYKPPGA